MSQTSTLTAALSVDIDSAFPEVVAGHIDGLYSGAYRLTGSRQDAEDVVQEAFVRAHRALCRYEPDRIADLKLEPWLWTITLNLCRNLARSKTRRPHNVDLGAVAEPPSSDNTEEAALDLLDTEWFERLQELPTHERIAVVLRHVVGLSYRELSQAVDRPLGTTKSDVHRGLERLREIIATERTPS